MAEKSSANYKSDADQIKALKKQVAQLNKRDQVRQQIEQADNKQNQAYQGLLKKKGVSVPKNFGLNGNEAKFKALSGNTAKIDALSGNTVKAKAFSDNGSHNVGFLAKLRARFDIRSNVRKMNASTRRKIKQKNEVRNGIMQYNMGNQEEINDLKSKNDTLEQRLKYRVNSSEYYQGHMVLYRTKFRDMLPVYQAVKAQLLQAKKQATKDSQQAYQNGRRDQKLDDSNQHLNDQVALTKSQTREKTRSQMFDEARINQQSNQVEHERPGDGLYYHQPNDPLAGKGDQLHGPSGLQNQHGQKINFMTNNRGQIIKRGSAADESPDSGQQKDSGKSKDDDKQLGD